MTRTIEKQTLREATSRDGTTIGYWSSGRGRPLLLVHGGMGDHARWDALRPYLEPHFAVHAMDRRGRGASGDGPEYALAREHEDVAAVVDAIAAESGSPVAVYCSSYGGLCTWGAAALTTNIDRLALYEAWPLRDPAVMAGPDGMLERIEARLAAGDREGALIVAYRELLGLTDDQVDQVRSQPSWSARTASAHTAPREIGTFEQTVFDPDQAAAITVPVLLLTGSESGDAWHPHLVRDAIPDARLVVMEGQEHLADLLAPELVAEALVPFLQAAPAP